MSEFSTIMRLLERVSADIKEVKERLEHPSILFANQDAVSAGATQEIMDCLDEGECRDERPGYRGWKCVKPSGHYGHHGYGGVFWSHAIDRDELQEHIDAVYDMLNERFSAAKYGSKAEKAIGEVMTFMEMNPV